MRKSIQLGVAFAATGIIASVAVPGATAHADSKTVTVGVVGTQDNGLWKEVAKTAKQKYGITIKQKVFTDYNQPNQAVASGDIDINAFQHYNFLNNWNKSNSNKVVALGKTYIAPINLYSNKVKSVKDIKKGATIAIPNDATNEGRALNLLKNAGLITLKKGVALPTTKDIKANKLNLKISAISADQTPSTLKSDDAAVINNNYAQAAKISANKSIFTEPVNKDSEQWINILAVNKGQQNKQVYKDVLKAYQTEQTKKYIKKTWGNTEIAAWDIKLK